MTGRYTHVRDDKESLELDADRTGRDGLLGPDATWARRREWRWKPSCNASALISAACAVFLSNLATAAWVATSLRRGRPGTFTETSVFSPVHERVKIPMVDKVIDASPAPNASDPAHVYRMPPSPEVDAAWDRITDIGMFPISRADVVRIQKDPDVSIVPPESWGMGSDERGEPMHFMEIDVFHQLHCLNALRKGLVHNYDYYWGQYGFVPKSNFERHLNHCLDIVRQALMCHADVEAVVFNWRETQDFAYPDFGVHRMCKDWDALLEWSEANKMDS